MSGVSPLARYLASYLAGPVLKGETGTKVGADQLNLALAMLANAKLADSTQQRQPVEHAVPWLMGR